MLKRSRLAPSTKPLVRKAPPATRRSASAAQRRANEEVDAGPRFCIACGGSYQLTRSHCLTQKQWPNHAANPANIVFLCQPHHTLWEHNKNGFAHQFPEAFAQKLAIIKQLEPTAYAVYAMKFPHLIP